MAWLVGASSRPSPAGAPLRSRVGCHVRELARRTTTQTEKMQNRAKQNTLRQCRDVVIVVQSRGGGGFHARRRSEDEVFMFPILNPHDAGKCIVRECLLGFSLASSSKAIEHARDRGAEIGLRLTANRPSDTPVVLREPCACRKYDARSPWRGGGGRREARARRHQTTEEQSTHASEPFPVSTQSRLLKESYSPFFFTTLLGLLRSR